jgi:hypothetical protein
MLVAVHLVIALHEELIFLEVDFGLLILKWVHHHIEIHVQCCIFLSVIGNSSLPNSIIVDEGVILLYHLPVQLLNLPAVAWI